MGFRARQDGKIKLRQNQALATEASPQGLSKLWTIELREMEARGEHLSVLACIPESMASLVPRLHSARLRAQAMNAATLAELKPIARQIERALHDECDTEARAVFLLALSYVERRRSNWDRALELTEAALHAAQSCGQLHLEADARFGRGLCWVEMGRIYLGLDEFEHLRRNVKLTSFRRSLSALNEAWILWDLGRCDAMERLKTELPHGYETRVQLALELARGETTLLKKLAEHQLPQGLPLSERQQIYTLLTEGLCVLDPEHKISRENLVHELEAKESSSPTCLALLSILKGQAWSCETPTRSWREALELAFLSFLSLSLTGSPEIARELWAREIAPVLDERNLKTPLIPHFSIESASFVSETPWARSLSALAKVACPAADRPVCLRLILNEGIVRDEAGQTLCDLRKSPVSCRLLEILAGPKGRKITKRYIHQQLTRSLYSPTLHDSRIHKLLKRLHERLMPGEADLLWNMSGDNTVSLCCTLEVQNREPKNEQA